jgi:hypothetical protein
MTSTREGDGGNPDGREELIALALPESAHPGAKKALAGILIERPEPAAA